MDLNCDTAISLIASNHFHMMAMYSATRAALLGSGQIAEYANDRGGFAGITPKRSSTVPEVLRH